jgi:hypothetical protein
MGSSDYRFRFSPDATGTWEWQSVCPAHVTVARMMGQIECVPGKSAGALIARGKDFAHEDGSPHLLVAIEVDWLWALDLDSSVKTAPMEGFIKHIASFGFNHALVNTYANWSAWNAADPVDGGFAPRTMPRVSPTILTPWAADQRYSHDQAALSLPFFAHWDAVIATMGRYNLTAHMMLYVGNKEVNWPTRGSEDDNTQVAPFARCLELRPYQPAVICMCCVLGVLMRCTGPGCCRYWHYVLARFGAYSNIVLDISKEAGSYGTTVSMRSL